MRILSIDYGTINTGFAIGEQGLTMPYGAIRTKDKTTLINRIKKIISNEKIDLIIVGLPVHKNQKQMEIVKKFVSSMKSEIECKVETVEEQNTSKEAFSENYTKHSGIKDLKSNLHSLSAEKILQNYYRQLN